MRMSCVKGNQRESCGAQCEATHIRRLLRQRLQLFIRNDRRAPRLGRLVPRTDNHLYGREPNGSRRRLRREGEHARGDGRAERGGGSEYAAEGECSVHGGSLAGVRWRHGARC